MHHRIDVDCNLQTAEYVREEHMIAPNTSGKNYPNFQNSRLVASRDSTNPSMGYDHPQTLHDNVSQQTNTNIGTSNNNNTRNRFF